MLKLSSLFLLLLISMTSFSQSDFRTGYIIKNNGDTIYGEIDYRGDLIMADICKFRTEQGSSENYKPGEIKGYRFIDSKYFITKEIDGSQFFLEFLFSGIVNLYYLRDYQGDHYLIERDTLPLTELINKKTIRYIGQRTFLHESTDYVRTLNLFMHDAKGIYPKIESIQGPQHRDLIKIAEYYHNTVCKDQKCIIYEKQIPLIQVSIEPVIAITQYNQSKKFKPEFGANIYFWAPGVNEKLFIKTGVQISKLFDPNYNNYPPDDPGDTVLVTKIPLQIIYSPNARLINPRIGLGINLTRWNIYGYKTDFVSPCLFFGARLRITRKISIAIDFYLESSPFLDPFEETYSLRPFSSEVGFIFKI